MSAFLRGHPATYDCNTGFAMKGIVGTSREHEARE